MTDLTAASVKAGDRWAKAVWKGVAKSLNGGVALPVNTPNGHPIAQKADDMVLNAARRLPDLPEDPALAVSMILALHGRL